MIDDDQDELELRHLLSHRIPEAPKTDPAPGRTELLSFDERVRAALAREGIENPSFEERMFAGMGFVFDRCNELDTMVRGESSATRAELRELAKKIEDHTETIRKHGNTIESLDAEMRGVDLELGSLKRQSQSNGNGNGNGNGHHGDHGR